MRPTRDANHEAENRALVSLTREMAGTPAGLLQGLAEAVLDLCQAHSAGVSFLEMENGREVLRCKAAAGRLAANLGATITPPFNGPANDVVVLVQRPKHWFAASGDSPVMEALVSSFSCNGVPTGIIWVAAHNEGRKFDAEDARLLQTLSRFAATAHRMDSDSYRQTSHLRVEQQLRIFDTLLSAIADFAYIFDRDGRFLYVNKALLNLWGLKLEDAVGKDFFDLKYPHELAVRLQNQIRRVFETGSPLRDETSYTSPTGAGGYYDYIFTPVFDDEGNVEVVAGSTRDITERRQTEEAFRESEERLKSLAATLETEVHTRTQEVLAQSEQIRELSRRLLQTQDKERRHIARELHDSAGQTLVVLIMQLARFVPEVNRVAPHLVKNVEEIEQIAQQLNREIRTASYLLHPPLLDESGLRAAVDWYVRGLAERSGLDIHFNIASDFGRCDSEIELVVFRLVQECLTNVHRHSGSKSAQIRLAREGKNVLLEVEDQGQGMAPEQLAQVQAQNSGVGIRGMRERVQQLHGEWKIQSTDSGTKISVLIPAPKSPSSAVA